MNSLQTKKKCEVFNLGTGKSVSINYLFQIIKKITNSNPIVIKKKLDFFDPKKSSGKFSKISKFLKLKKYRYTKLETGLKQTIENFNLRN